MVRASRRTGLIPAWAGRSYRDFPSHRDGRAHPRVGGEVAGADVDDVFGAGSSTRGRGGRIAGDGDGRNAGLIPAWAGRSTSPSTATTSNRAHPRVGGEVGVVRNRLAGLQGSSPRGRGGPTQGAPAAPWRGLIPAWAGRSSTTRPPRLTRRAHPRVGGEVPSASTNESRATGSSPRGRGGRSTYWAAVVTIGLIPAWAGRSSPSIERPKVGGAHPRVGGEVTSLTSLTR